MKYQNLPARWQREAAEMELSDQRYQAFQEGEPFLDLTVDSEAVQKSILEYDYRIIKMKLIRIYKGCDK